MGFQITDRFKKNKENTNSSFFSEKEIESHFLGYEDKKRVIARIKRYEKVGYLNVEDRYTDVLNIDKYYFYALLEVDDFFLK